MRWGVRDEMTNEHMTTELCMTELRNCQVRWNSSQFFGMLKTACVIKSLQRLSMGPNFIYFGGQKYGYRPIPTDIVTSELSRLREVSQIYKASRFL